MEVRTLAWAQQVLEQNGAGAVVPLAAGMADREGQYAAEARQLLFTRLPHEITCDDAF